MKRHSVNPTTITPLLRYLGMREMSEKSCAVNIITAQSHKNNTN